MDSKLKNTLEFSDFRSTLNLQRQQLKDKLEADLVYGYNGGLFKISMQLINFVELMLNKGKNQNVPILDDNNNPVMVEDLEKFRDEILDRYVTAVNLFYLENEKIKKSRTLKKLLDL
jgi:hypothetical protein